MHECFLFNFTNSCNICLVDSSKINMLQSKNRFIQVVCIVCCIKFRFFHLLIPQNMPCKISINLFFITFLLSKANFGIKDYTENIQKIFIKFPHHATGRKTTQESYPRDRRKKLFSSFSGCFSPLFCIMNTSSSHKNPFNNQTVTQIRKFKNPSLCSIHI